MPSYPAERIVDERTRRVNGRRQTKFLVKYKDYPLDEKKDWTLRQNVSADLIDDWEAEKRRQRIVDEAGLSDEESGARDDAEDGGEDGDDVALQPTQGGQGTAHTSITLDDEDVTMDDNDSDSLSTAPPSEPFDQPPEPTFDDESSTDDDASDETSGSNQTTSSSGGEVPDVKDLDSRMDVQGSSDSDVDMEDEALHLTGNQFSNDLSNIDFAIAATRTEYLLLNRPDTFTGERGKPFWYPVKHVPYHLKLDWSKATARWGSMFEDAVTDAERRQGHRRAAREFFTCFYRDSEKGKIPLLWSRRHGSLWLLEEKHDKLHGLTPVFRGEDVTQRDWIVVFPDGEDKGYTVAAWKRLQAARTMGVNEKMPDNALSVAGDETSNGAANNNENVEYDNDTRIDTPMKEKIVTQPIEQTTQETQTETTSIQPHGRDVEMKDDDFIPLEFGGMSPDYINEPGAVPSMTDILEHDLEEHFGGPIYGREAVGLRMKGIGGWMPGNLEVVE